MPRLKCKATAQCTSSFSFYKGTVDLVLDCSAQSTPARPWLSRTKTGTLIQCSRQTWVFISRPMCWRLLTFAYDQAKESAKRKTMQPKHATELQPKMISFVVVVPFLVVLFAIWQCVVAAMLYVLVSTATLELSRVPFAVDSWYW